MARTSLSRRFTVSIEEDYEYVQRHLLDRIAELELLIEEEKEKPRKTNTRLRELEGLLKQNVYCYHMIQRPPTSYLQ